jgi:hypothetical protein
MQGDGTPAFQPGYKRFRVLQGSVPSYCVVGHDGRVVASDREPWLRFNWRVLRRRLLERGAVVEELDAQDADGGQDGAA